MSIQKSQGVFEFKVFVDKDIYRVFEIHGNNTLEDLAEYILHVFKFDCDHAYGFYNKGKSEAYELFYDLDMGVERGVKGVQKTFIQDVFQPKKQMIFLFDYGDEWTFLVECIGLSNPIAKAKYPKLIKKFGRAPKQYEDYDDE